MASLAQSCCSAPRSASGRSTAYCFVNVVHPLMRMLPFHAQQNQYLIDVERINAANAGVSPFALHIPICTAAHMSMHTVGNSSDPRTWSFAPCHGSLSQHVTIQPCCTTPLAVTPQLMAATPHVFQQQPHQALPPPPPYQVQQLTTPHRSTPSQSQELHHQPYTYRQYQHAQFGNNRQHQQYQLQQHAPSTQQHFQYSSVTPHLAASSALLPTASVISPHVSGVNALPREDMLTDPRQMSFVHISPSAASASSSSASRSSVARLGPPLHGATSSAVPPPPPPPPAFVFTEPHVVHPIVSRSQDYTGSVPRYRRASATRRRWQTFPPPPYPGFLLHFLSALGRPTVATHRVHVHRINEETDDLDSYEALLNLAERIGDAKPRGLTREVIDRLPSYRFNAELRKPASADGVAYSSNRAASSPDMQTSCVVCLCDFQSRQLLRSLPCRHEFHARCIDKWLKVNRSCPICRADTLEFLNSESTA